MKTIKVFLASSSELREHKEKFEVMIVELNKIYITKGIEIEFSMWEYIPSINGEEVQQKECQKRIADSDIFVALFQTRTGEHTKNGIETAYTNHCQSENKRPSIQIYVRTPEDGVEIAESLKEFVKELEEKYAHFNANYSHIDTLKYKFHVQLELLESELKLGFTIQNGKLRLNGVEFVDLESLSFMANNSYLIGLKKRLKDLDENIKECKESVDKTKERLLKYSDDAEFQEELKKFETRYTELHAERRELDEDINEQEKSLLDFSLSLAREQSKSSAKLIRDAVDLFEQGDSKGAMAVLKIFTEDEDRIASEFDNLRDRTSEKLSELKDKIKGNLLQATGVMTEYDTLDRFAQACGFYKKAIELGEGRIENSEQADNIFKYAEFLNVNNTFKYAEFYFIKALNKYKQLGNTYNGEIAKTLYALGYTYRKQLSFSSSKIIFQEALGIYKFLASVNSDKYSTYVAMTLDSLADLYSNLNEYQNAEEMYNEALKIRKLLVETNRISKLDLAITLNNLGILYRNCEKYLNAEKVYNEALAILLTNPTYIRPVADTLNNLAIIHDDLNNYLNADEEYRKALETYRVLALMEPEAYSTYVAMTLNNWASLHDKLDNYDIAEREYKEALKIRRSLTFHSQQVAMTLNNWAVCHYNSGKYFEAEVKYKEAFAIYGDLAIKAPNAYNPDVALTLNNLGILYEIWDNNYFEASKWYSNAVDKYQWCCDNLSQEIYKSKLDKAISNRDDAIKARGRTDEVYKSYMKQPERILNSVRIKRI